jgi:hypothetical protein
MCTCSERYKEIRVRECEASGETKAKTCFELEGTREIREVIYERLRANSDYGRCEARDRDNSQGKRVGVGVRLRVQRENTYLNRCFFCHFLAIFF